MAYRKASPQSIREFRPACQQPISKADVCPNAVHDEKVLGCHKVARLQDRMRPDFNGRTFEQVGFDAR